MKKIMGVIIALVISNPAYAGFFNGDWFEPTIFCLGAGASGYSSASKGNEVNNAAMYCAGGALIGYLINSHYKDKYSSQFQEEILDLKKSIHEVEVMQANKASRGEDDEFSMKVQEIVPGKKLPNGEVLAPTIRERLIIPGEGTRVGD